MDSRENAFLQRAAGRGAVHRRGAEILTTPNTHTHTPPLLLIHLSLFRPLSFFGCVTHECLSKRPLLMVLLTQFLYGVETRHCRNKTRWNKVIVDSREVFLGWRVSSTKLLTPTQETSVRILYFKKQTSGVYTLLSHAQRLFKPL